MAFVKKTWKDRLSEFPGRRLLTKISGSADGQMVVDVTRNEGTVSQAGDAFSAVNMNDMEQRIGDEFDEINNNLSECKFIIEGNGADTEYYIQRGADTASKKLLGKISSKNIKVLAKYNAVPGLDIIKKGTYIATKNMTVLVSYYYGEPVLTRPSTNGLILYQSPQISSSGQYYYALSIISLKKDQYVDTYSRQNGEGYVIQLD